MSFADYGAIRIGTVKIAKFNRRAGSPTGPLPAMKVKKWAPAFDDNLERSGGVARRRESGAVFGGDVVAAWKLSTVMGTGCLDDKAEQPKL
jgi:hypothetical protein